MMAAVRLPFSPVRTHRPALSILRLFIIRASKSASEGRRMTKDEVRALYREGAEKLLPHHMRGGVERWMEYGIKPGTFLSFLLMGDRAGAVGCADFDNLANMHGWDAFLRCYLPTDAHGTMLRFAGWIKLKGLSGVPEYVKDMRVGQ